MEEVAATGNFIQEFVVNEENANRLLSFWQKQLRIEDWNVFLYIKRIYDMREDSIGRCAPAPSTRTAVIALLHPGDYAPSICTPYDMEQTLVHELLHVSFAASEPDPGDKHLMFEQSLDALSYALVNLNREKRR